MKNLLGLLFLGLFSISVKAQMSSDIVGVAAASKDHSTLIAAVKAAGLVETLKSSGPFTVFAPTNEAFENLPDGALADLLKPESKNVLASILKYHVVAGNLDAKAIIAAISAGGGKAVLSTVEGGKLTGTLDGGKLVLTDEKGGKTVVTTTDLKASNGIVHVIEGVMMPK